MCRGHCADDTQILQCNNANSDSRVVPLRNFTTSDKNIICRRQYKMRRQECFESNGKYAQTPLSRVVRLRPLRQNGENIKGRAGVYPIKRSKRGGFASYCRLRLLAKVIDNVSFSCYNGLIARRMMSALFGFPCACSARTKPTSDFSGEWENPLAKRFDARPAQGRLTNGEVSKRS